MIIISHLSKNTDVMISFLKENEITLSYQTQDGNPERLMI